MADPGVVADPRVQKLELAIKKGDLYVSQLSKQGIDTTSIKSKLDEARTNLENGDIVKAFGMVQEYINEMNRLKSEKTEKKTDEGPKIEEAEDRKISSSSKKGKGVFALIRDDERDQRKKDEWKALVEKWRELGYDFEEDESLFSHPFSELEKRITSIDHQISKGEGIRSRISTIRSEFDAVGHSYKNKIDDVESAVLKLDRLDDQERRLNSLIATLKSVESRYKTLRNRIGRYKRQGLNTNNLEEMIETDEDLDYLDKQFNIFEGNIEFLLKEKMKFNELKSNPGSKNYQKEVRDIENIIDDPWMLDTVVEKTISLEKLLMKESEKEKKQEDEKKRRKEIRESLDRYRSEGFIVDMVEQLLEDDMNLLEEEFDQLIRNIAKLKSLREKLFTLNASGFEDNIAQISTHLNDPSNIVKVEKDLNELKDKIVNQRVKSQKIETSIKRWTGMGYMVSKLEETLKRDNSKAEKLYEDYSRRIEELSQIEDQIKDIKHREISDQIHKLLLKVKNPELIEQVRNEWNILSGKISELEELKDRRKDLNLLLKEWKNQGFNIDKILILMKEANQTDGLENIILNYTRSVATLKSIETEFSKEERGWFRKEEDFIRNHIHDLEMGKEVIGAFEDLKSKNKEEEKRRGQIVRKLKGLSEKGIDTSMIENLLTGEKESLDKEYKKYINLTKRLLKLKADLLRDAHKNKDKAKEELAKSMNDPYKIDEYEKKSSGEKGAPIPEEGSGAGKTRDLDIKSLRSLAKAAYKEKKYLEALGFFEAILAIDPSHKESLFYRKKALMKLKEQSPDIAISSSKPYDEGKISVEKKEGATQKETPAAESPQPLPEAKGLDPSCISCSGTGECSWCSGEGKCSSCNGTGKYFGDTCSTCKGSGRCSVCDGSGKCSWCNR
ncbi:MAG: hypothetical protein ACMUIG_05660 [Thermoplasmatota archaeon]